MDECVNRKALRDALYDADAITMEGVKIINQFPSADVAAVRRGRWIYHPDDLFPGDSTQECSHCHEERMGERMKAKSYKLKYTPTEEQLIKELSARSGGFWIDKNSKLYISKFFELPEYDFEFSIDICFKEDISDWNDFDNVLVLDEDFGQPYTPFYGKNYKKEISNHPCLEYCIEKYNEFMDSFDFLCEVSE